MKRRTAKLEVTSAPDVPRGTWLQIGDGEESDLVQVLAAHGTTVKIGRVRWWHRAWWWLQELPGVIWRGLRRLLCTAGRHRLGSEDYGMRHCWCRWRWEDGADWDDAWEYTRDDEEVGE